MQFKVKLVKKKSENPFDPVELLGSVQEARVFEMDCGSEAEVRAFFKEAKDAGHPNVDGYEIHSIEVVTAGGKKRRERS